LLGTRPVGWRVLSGARRPGARLRRAQGRRSGKRGARLRRQGSNLRLASNSRVSYRLDYAGTAEAAGFEPARRSPALRRSKALPFHSAMPLRRKERESNPQGPVGPTRFRNGIPRPWQSFPVTPAGIEPATSRLRVGCSAALSYGAALRGRQESNLRRTAFQTDALPAELRPQVMSEAGIEPATSCL
jgi:hypothetical protein